MIEIAASPIRNDRRRQARFPASAPRPRPAAPSVPRMSLPNRRCRAITRKGFRCPIGPRPSGLCHVHDPAVQCGAPRRAGGRCGTATGGGRCRAHRHTPAENHPMLPIDP
ncbi:hypothetical protein Asi02nite_67280 [Asanoa siamensis]|uniref:C3H1-type domain-containing protein n=1 Tax=Asanoa siamensis TaxID=926357 RepID=A0ABQ4D0Z0_9ACTN|nr:hypothetical protein Asi02nite_67280 [Asanoa siamensis]